MTHGWKRTMRLAVALVLTTAGCQSVCWDSSGHCAPLFRKPLPIEYWFVNPSRACCVKKQPTFGRYWDVFDAWYVKDRARKCGMAAIKRMVKQTGSVPSVDYRRGFVQAYVDIAMGSDGQLPPVPPQDYWGAFGRSREGHQRAAEWFRGYADGVQQARSCDLEHFGTVPTSVSGDETTSESWAPEDAVCPDGRCGGLSPTTVPDGPFGYSSGLSSTLPVETAGNVAANHATGHRGTQQPYGRSVHELQTGVSGPTANSRQLVLDGAGYAEFPGLGGSSANRTPSSAAARSMQMTAPGMGWPAAARSVDPAGVASGARPALVDGPAYGPSAPVRPSAQGVMAPQWQSEVPPFADAADGSPAADPWAGISQMSYDRPATGERGIVGDPASAAANASPPLWPYAPQARHR